MPAPAISPDANKLFVVDPDTDFLQWAATHLRAADVEVHCFERAEDVVAAYAKVKPDILICEARLPGMSGIELRRRIKAAYPQLPVLLTSGYTAHLIPEFEGAPPVLHKPYTLDALAEAVRGAILGSPA